MEKTIQNSLFWNSRSLPIYAAVSVFAVKLLFLLTHHIQEDAFITWRVAQNLMDYGVIGFNGSVKISASTTHLYVFVSYLFNLIFGREHFMYPILLFNSALFTAGSFLLAKMLFVGLPLRQGIFIIIFGLLPPGIKISILGMEYGLLFFLEMLLLYYGFFQNKSWAVFILPTLILFTRVDTVIFLGILFLIKTIAERKIQWQFVIGGLIGLATVLTFNQLYFHEWVNNTILAKKLAYDRPYTPSQSAIMLRDTFGNFWGMLKIPKGNNWFTILILAVEFASFLASLKILKGKSRFVLIFIFAFGWIKQLIFLFEKSYFDWYYWVPQLLLFVPILFFVLEKFPRKKIYLAAVFMFFFLPMLAYQTVHSIATGNGEWNYRRQIGVFLNDYEKDKNQWIFLEPAGFIPYYSHLKTIDEVGLVDKGVQTEMKKDKPNYWFNVVKNRQPKYILAYRDLSKDPHADFYLNNYRVLKKFYIKDQLKSDYAVLRKIYEMKPSGRDYILYEKLELKQ